MTYDEKIINFIFEDDEGMLLDIYILHTTLDDWQRVLDALRDSSYAVTFTDGQSTIPDSVKDFFPANDTEYLARSMQVQVDGVQIRCNFFAVDEIEFYLDPIQVAGVEQAELVIQYYATPQPCHWEGSYPDSGELPGECADPCVQRRNHTLMRIAWVGSLYDQTEPTSDRARRYKNRHPCRSAWA